MRKNKLYVNLVIFLIFISFVYAYTITSFFDGTTTGNITVTGAEGTFKNLSIPYWAIVTKAELDLEGYPFFYCYQETANISTSCGGLATGKYSIDVVPKDVIAEYYFYMNYTKPDSANNLSLWTVKHGNDTEVAYNISLPLACWEQNPLTLRIGSYFKNSVPRLYYSVPYCYNGTNWLTIGINHTDTSSSAVGITNNSEFLFDGDYGIGNLAHPTYSGWVKQTEISVEHDTQAVIWEEAMYWAISPPKNITISTNGEITYQNLSIFNGTVTDIDLNTSSLQKCVNAQEHICYQENETSTAECNNRAEGNLLDGGFGTWNNTYTYANTYDKDYSTYGKMVDGDSDLFQEWYPKPYGVESAIYQYKYYSTSRGAVTGNITIPSNCFSNALDTVVVQIGLHRGVDAVETFGSFYLGCYSTLFSDMFTDFVSASDEIRFYESGIFWVYGNATCSLNFTSATRGLLAYSNLDIEYTAPEIDNCSDYTIPIFNFSTYDEITGNLINSNITFSINYVWNEDTDTDKYLYLEQLNRDIYEFCQEPQNVEFTGSMDNFVEASGYSSRTYTLTESLLGGVYKAYLLPNTYSTQITFSLIDSASEPIENALFSIYRNIGGNSTLIYQQYSDFAGQVVTYLDQAYTYDFTINASGFPFKEFSLQPSQTSYILTLTSEGSSFYTPTYEGVRYRIWYNGQLGLPTLINVTNTTHNITFEVEGTNLYEIGINLTHHNYNCTPVSCSDTLLTSTGGTVTVGILINESGYFNTAFWFQRIGGDRIYVNDGIIKAVPFVFIATDSLLDFVDELKENTSPNMRIMLLTFVNVIAIGIGSYIGLIGLALIIPVVAVIVLAGLPSVGLINPFISLIMAIVGVGLYALSQMRQ